MRCHCGIVCLASIVWLLSIFPSMAQDAVFPLSMPPQGSYLQDSRGHPFLLIGDSAWSMIADLSLEDAEHYLDTRKRQGFNTILVSLLEHKFARNAPANHYGEVPFNGMAFAQPNDAYFDRAARFIEAAARQDMLVLLCPAYLGANGGSEGWYEEMVAAGTDRLSAYGQYVGARLGKFPNLIWVQGGDYDPPDRTLVNAVAKGIASVAPGAVQTVHANRDTTTHAYWQAASWLDIDTVYTYGDAAGSTIARYRAGPHRPFFLIEAKYEGENGADESDIRLAAYGALLSGAGGQIFGNNPVWHFSGKGIFHSSVTWKQALYSEGARSISILAGLFKQLEWWKLQPDQGVLVKATTGAKGAIFAARDIDGRFAVIYARGIDRVTLDLSLLPDGTKRLLWIDPSNGSSLSEFEHLDGSSTPTVGTPHQSNGSGFHDWIGIFTNAEASGFE